MSTSPASVVRDLVIGLIIGVFSGLFGLGGGVILVPLLVLLFRVEQKRAQATSLVVVAIAAVSGAVSYSVGASVVWPAVPFLIGGGLVGVWLGTILVLRVAVRWLQIALAIVMVIAAVRLVIVSLEGADTGVPELGVGVALGHLATGFIMGLFSSMLGVGGGVVVVPILVTVFGFSQQLAQGSSLVVIVPLALLGAWRLTKSGFTQWGEGLRMGVAAAVGAVGGAVLALVIASQALQIGFAAVLVFAATQLVRKALR